MIGRHLALLSCCAALAACNSANYGWSRATTLDTIAAYQTYLSKYPNGPHAVDAQSRIAALQDEKAWNTAQVASSLEGYQQYLATEPNGAHAQTARDDVAMYERENAWRTAQTNGTTQAYEEFLKQYPTGSEADAARDKLKTLAGYRAELGMSRTEKQADRRRDALAKRFGKDLQNQNVEVLAPDANSREFRITSAPMSEQDASAACASIKREGQSCKVIQVTS
jgi:outer membrane protein assembly factor BamD (BamD/ComL family)